MRIRIRIIFGLKVSPEYEYEYHYSVSTIRILFEYRIIRSPLCRTITINERQPWQPVPKLMQRCLTAVSPLMSVCLFIFVVLLICLFTFMFLYFFGNSSSESSPQTHAALFDPRLSILLFQDLRHPPNPHTKAFSNSLKQP